MIDRETAINHINAWDRHWPYGGTITVNKIIAALSPQWQDIATAPKDGTPVDLWVFDKIAGFGWREPDAHWDDKKGWVTIDYERGVENVGHEGIQIPLAWMTIPEAPAQ